MGKGKSEENEIAEAIKYVDDVIKQAPDGNQTVIDKLFKVRKELQEDLVEAVLRKSKKTKKD